MPFKWLNLLELSYARFQTVGGFQRVGNPRSLLKVLWVFDFSEFARDSFSAIRNQTGKWANSNSCVSRRTRVEKLRVTAQASRDGSV